MVLTAAGAVAACGNVTEAPGPGVGAVPDSLTALPRAITVVERQAISANNAFALSLLREEGQQGTKNALLSPYSVSMALGLTMNGATGLTESEMRRTLGWGSRTRAEINAAYRDLDALLPTLDPAVSIRSVNGIWVRNPLRADTGFASDAARYFKATVRSEASPAAMFDAVNAWANEATEGMIPKALSGAPPTDLVMLLANALLFKGSWRSQFDPANTAARPFRLDDGTTVAVPLMMRTGGFRGAGDERAQAAELPYGNSAYSMLVLVPRTGTIGSFVATLDSARLAGYIVRLQEQEGSTLTLPKFRASTTKELGPTLRKLGMPRAFSGAAEFPRLFADGKGGQIDFVQHSVAVDVDEVGTRAAAVTVVGITRVSAPESFSVNRSFVFFIRERLSGALLFAGVVRDPRA